MISTIGELCDAALNYLITINVGNKYKTYTPEGSLRPGTIIKKWDYVMRVPTYNSCRDVNTNISVQTVEPIPNEYLASVTNQKIADDWNEYKHQYILPKINSDVYISVSSMFYFIYLLRHFIDKRFKLFTDIYGITSVWLYNTQSSISYSPANILLNDNEINDSVVDKYVNALINEVVSRDTLKTLQASTSFNSCSSSSSSSSCSSSSSSSSCSSSSSSSSSLFIAYFNLG